MASPSGRHNRAKLTIPAAKVQGSHVNFPVTLLGSNMPSEMWSGDNRCADNGGDLYFGNLDGSIRYPLDIRYFDRATQTCSMVVVIPSISDSGNNDFYVFWGKSNTNQPPPSSEGGQFEVYSTAEIYECWPLNGTLTSDDEIGRSEKQWVGDAINTPDIAASAKIFRARHFDPGDNERFDIIDSSAETDFEAQGLSPPGPFTVSAWVYWDGGNGSSQKCIIGKFNSGVGWKLSLESNETVKMHIDGGANDAYAQSAVSVPQNEWHFIVGTHDGSGLALGTKVFIDGVDVSSSYGVDTAGSLSCGDRVGIAAESGNDPNNEWSGDLEEVRYENKNRSDDWIKTIYVNQNDIPNFVIPAAREFFGNITRQKSLKITTKGDYVDGFMLEKDLLIDEKQIPNIMWSNAKFGGGDIIASTDAAGQVRIPIEIVTFDTSFKLAEIYVNMPSVSPSGGSSCYLHYDAVEDEEQPFPDNTVGRDYVWNPNGYKGVWHGNQISVPGTLSEADLYIDSSGSGNHGQGNLSPTRINAKMGYGQQGNGTDRRIIVGDSGFPEGNSPSTMSGWAKFNADFTEQSIMGYGTASAGNRRVIQQRSQGIGFDFSFHFWGIPQQQDGWTYVTMVVPNGVVNTDENLLYINGVLQKSITLAGTVQVINTIKDYRQLLRGTDGAFSSVEEDEWRISSVPFTAEWIKLDFFNQVDTLNVWAADEITNEDLYACCLQLQEILKHRGFRRERPSRQELMDKIQANSIELLGLRRQIRNIIGSNSSNRNNNRG